MPYGMGGFLFLEDAVYYKTRAEDVAFLKRLWQEEPTLCPKCGGAELVFLHKKAKKSNNDWKCPACGEIYRTINMMMDLPNE